MYRYTLPTEVVMAGLEAPEFWVTCTLSLSDGYEAGILVDKLSPGGPPVRFHFC